MASRIRLWLMVLPIGLIGALAQAYFWVPTYERQAADNPGRLSTLVLASIADAKILNPILNADSASARIANLVFDPLLTNDADLELTGRLAKTWSVTETAYLRVDAGTLFPDGTPITALALKSRLNDHLAATPAVANRLRRLSIEPESTSHQSLEVAVGEEKVGVQATLRTPARLRIELSEVMPELLKFLTPVLGGGYGADFDPTDWVTFSPAEHGPEALKQLTDAWPIVEHNPVISFQLRDDVVFHDGHGFDANDVVFTYKAVMDRRNLSPRTSAFEPIKSVVALGPYHVEVRYKRLFAPAVEAWTLGILPEHLLNDAALATEMDERKLSAKARDTFGLRNSRFNRNPIGTGPFKFEQWQSDELIHLTANTAYFDGGPRYQNYYYRVIPDTLTQEIEFRTGALDVYGPEPHQAARYRADDRYQALSALRSGFSYIAYNHRRAPFDDVRVRRALGMAIDVDDIIRYILDGEGVRTTGPLGVESPWYDDTIAPLPFDPEGAQALLKEAGFQRNADGWFERDGRVLELNLITNNGNQTRKAILGIAQNQWRNIGVLCQTQLFEWAVFLNDFVNPGDFDALVLGWGNMETRPDLFDLFHSTQTGPNQLNFVGYKNPQVDTLIEALRLEYDEPTRRKMARQLHRLLADEQPYTFLYVPRSTVAFDKKIVMLDDDDNPHPLRVPKGDDIFFYLRQWQKLEHVPEF